MRDPSFIFAAPARAMTVVLGIDAAWTLSRPSGVALVVDHGAGWTLRAVAPSYDHFLAIAAGRGSAAPASGSAPDATAMLAAAERIAGAAVDLVAIDMPLSHATITGRRASDNAIARVYGGWHCATHSPSSERPGPLSDALRADFAAAGYPLRTDDASLGGLIEVYPHPALVILAGERRRLPYKVGKTRAYWPAETLAARKALLRGEWRRIAALLATRIADVEAHLPPLPEGATGAALKAHEDMLDAIVCAWIGTTALAGTADPHGDAVSAIWVPHDPRQGSRERFSGERRPA